MVLGNKREPIKISYVTDTRPSKYINEIIKHSDLFICEGMYGNNEQYEVAVKRNICCFQRQHALQRTLM